MDGITLIIATITGESNTYRATLKEKFYLNQKTTMVSNLKKCHFSSIYLATLLI